jgi:hypothetical protein
VVYEKPLQSFNSLSFTVHTEQSQDICKIKNLDTGEEVDFNDIASPNFLERFSSITRLDEGATKAYV